MSFFDREPPSEPPTPLPEASPWLQEPRSVLGGVVGKRIVLATTSAFAVLAYDFIAFNEGVSFEVEGRPRTEFARPSPEFSFDLVMHARFVDGKLSPPFFRFGVEFDDGTRLTNLDDERRAERRSTEPPGHPVLRLRAGSGGGQGFTQRYWLWPLPQGETVSFVCEWPIADIPVSRATVETASISAAAAATRAYWGRTA